MKKDYKKEISSHIKKDSKEFKGQLKDDVKLKKMVKSLEIEKEKEKKTGKLGKRTRLAETLKSFNK